MVLKKLIFLKNFEPFLKISLNENVRIIIKEIFFTIIDVES